MNSRESSALSIILETRFSYRSRNFSCWRIHRPAIEQAAAGRTTLLITHRLSQIRWADLIVVLRNGEVSVVGNHETLLEQSEAYRNIFARYS